MPLPPLADNLTVRAWLKYTSMNTTHELCFRMPSGSTTSAISSTANTLVTGLTGIMHTTNSFIGLRYSAAGSNLSFPISFSSVAGTASHVAEKDDESKFLSVVGRSAAGYRIKCTFFTAAFPDTTGYRTALPSNLYNAVITAGAALVAKDGGAVIWNPYSNIGYNSYWQRQLR